MFWRRVRVTESHRRGDAAAATWILCVRRAAATPQPRRGYSGDESQRRRAATRLGLGTGCTLVGSSPSARRCAVRARRAKLRPRAPPRFRPVGAEACIRLRRIYAWASFARRSDNRRSALNVSGCAGPKIRRRLWATSCMIVSASSRSSPVSRSKTSPRRRTDRWIQTQAVTGAIGVAQVGHC